MISYKATGDFSKTRSFLERMKALRIAAILERHGRDGVSALAANTPVESGETAASWGYKVSGTRGSYKITWTNSHVNDGVPIAIVLQYGHGTGTGGYVAGRDYINPAIRPVFERIAADVWREVTAV